MVPTGIVAQNIRGHTIHSELKVVSTQEGFLTLTLCDDEF